MQFSVVIAYWTDYGCIKTLSGQVVWRFGSLPDLLRPRLQLAHFSLPESPRCLYSHGYNVKVVDVCFLDWREFLKTVLKSLKWWQKSKKRSNSRMQEDAITVSTGDISSGINRKSRIRVISSLRLRSASFKEWAQS